MIKPSAFGDVIHTIPVLVKLRARYPAARIDWLITPENAELIRYHPAVSNVILFARRHYARFGRSWSATAGLLRLLGTIWQARYELVIDLHGQLRSMLFTLASAAPVRIGFDRPRRTTHHSPLAITEHCLHGWDGAREGSWLAYSHRLPIRALDVHAVDRYLWLTPLLGLDQQPPDFTLHWPRAAEIKAQRLLAEYGLLDRPFAVVAPGTTWETKHWPADSFAEVGRHLLRMGLAVVLAGGPREQGRCQAVAAACPGARDLSGRTTLAEFAALMNRATISVTNDSGSMHLAAALRRPVVSIFGPTDPIRIGPYAGLHAVVCAELPCSPCYLKKLRQCPHDHACMKQVTPQLVMERIRRIFDF